MRHAVIAGATGLVGSELLKLLAAERQHPPITLLTRRPLADLPPDVEQIVIENMASEVALTPTIPAGAWVFCCVGTTMGKAKTQEAFKAVDLKIPLALGRAAKAAGAEGFSLVSAAGANSNAFFFYTRTKGQAEQGLQRLALHALHILRPGLLLGSRGEFRLGERIIQTLGTLLNPILLGPLESYRSVQARKVALTMLMQARRGRQGLRIYQGKALDA